MNTLQLIFIALVIFIHIYIVILEMVLWNKPKGIKTFKLKSIEFAEDTKVLAANQGLYNGFLVAGLIWSVVTEKNDVAIFFLACVFVAGIYGAYSTNNKRILIVQSIPALIGLISLLI